MGWCYFGATLTSPAPVESALLSRDPNRAFPNGQSAGGRGPRSWKTGEKRGHRVIEVGPSSFVEAARSPRTDFVTQAEWAYLNYAMSPNSQISRRRAPWARARC